MREIPERERVKWLVARLLTDLEPDMPRVTMPPRGGVLLRDAGVGSDRPVEEVIREGRKQLAHVGGKERQRPEHGLSDEHVRPWRPRECGCREERDRQESDRDDRCER